METTKAATPAPPGAWVADVRRRVLNWAPAHFQSYPWRRHLPFWQGLVVEVLLQRTRAPQVVPVFEEFRRRYPTAAAFGAVDEDELAQLLAPLGLRWRVPLFTRLAREVGRLRGRLPRDYEALKALPGVGPYAAGAALSLHGNRVAPVIDANTVRLVCRLLGFEYGAETRRVAWVHALFERLTPAGKHRAFNYGMLDLAMTVCMPRRPSCDRCPLASMCVYAKQSSLLGGGRRRPLRSGSTRA